MNEEITATLANLPNKPYIYEDMAELNRIIIEELSPATCIDGTFYKKSRRHNNWGKWRNKINGKGKEPVAVDEEKSSSDTPTKN